MTDLTAVILGIVEGITEFLPVSSTGHLILASTLLNLSQSEFLKSFEIAIQLGAILSVVVLYWRSIVFDKDMLGKVMAAFVPTAIAGFLLYKSIKVHLLGNSHVVLGALFAGGVLIIVLEFLCGSKKDRSQTETLSMKQAFLIGLFQSLAMVPGVSRSAATIMGGLMLGVSRKTIVEFSFLLAVPTMAAAVGYDLLKTSISFTADQWACLGIGFAVSFLTALASVKFLLVFIQRNNFIPFGIYRILLSLAFLFVLK